MGFVQNLVRKKPKSGHTIGQNAGDVGELDERGLDSFRRNGEEKGLTFNAYS